MLLVHLALIGRLELVYDEAYYQLWSRHLSWGYLDHPPMVAAWIRVSTAVFGQSEFGVRAWSVLAIAGGALVIFSTARALMDSRAIAALSVLFYNAMLLIAIGGIIVTPDAPLVAFWTLAICGLAKVLRTGDWRWWLLVGVSAGLALLSKYTALFLGAGIALSMTVVPGLRHWWRHPAPYGAAALALVIFAPVIVWNADHEWASFLKQFGRTAPKALTLRYLAEFAGAQAGLMNPFVFVLAAAGCGVTFKSARSGAQNGRAGSMANQGRTLLLASVLPALVYFFWHALHDRVQGNWPAPIYPALAILAADAAWRAEQFGPRLRRVLETSRRLALPTGLALTAIVYLQAVAAPLALGRKDPTSQLSGWRALAQDVEAVAGRVNAGYILTSGYALTSHLGVYMPAARPVIQYNERLRWIFQPPPDAAILGRRALYVAEDGKDRVAELRARFESVAEVARLSRYRGKQPLETFVVYRVETPTGAVLDQPVAISRGRSQAQSKDRLP